MSILSGNKYLTVLVLLGIAAVLFLYSRKQRAAEAEKKRREQLKKDYPELISRLLLLLQAGLVVRSAFQRIAADYKRDLDEGKKPRPAFGEVCETCAEMAKGISEEEAYRNFGKRCVLPVYRTLGVLLMQNLQKGGTALTEMLEREIVSAMEERKRTARTDGEKASIRLLLPMGMMLIVVLAIMVIPAFLSI